jgi:type II secretory pathway pseudopilin PulG
MKRVATAQSGMSLLEITFAAGIMATALSLIFGSLISISLVGNLNEDKALANTELASALEGIRALEFRDLMVYAPDVPSVPGVERTVVLECYDVDNTAVALPLAADVDGSVTVPELPNPLEVKVTLLWKNNKGHVFQAYATTSVGR